MGSMQTQTPPVRILNSDVDADALELHKNESVIKEAEAVLAWKEEQERLLKDWSETCAIYSWMHTKAHHMFKRKNIQVQLPVIILSTLTGTANFAHSSLPVSWQAFSPMVIGFVNIIAGILTTIAQFLRYAELSEGHRVSAISFGKLSRALRTELNLSAADRRISGLELLDKAHGELDRLIEQSPEIPTVIVHRFVARYCKDSNPDEFKLATPEIVRIQPVRVHSVLPKDLSRTSPAKLSLQMDRGLVVTPELNEEFNREAVELLVASKDGISQTEAGSKAGASAMANAKAKAGLANTRTYYDLATSVDKASSVVIGGVQNSLSAAAAGVQHLLPDVGLEDQVGVDKKEHGEEKEDGEAQELNHRSGDDEHELANAEAAV